MLQLKQKFKDAIIGLSDHSETIYPCLGAISLGASIVEKHFVTSKKLKDQIYRPLWTKMN